MNRRIVNRTQAAVLLIAGLLSSGLAMAAQNERAQERADNGSGRNGSAVAERRGHFEARQREVARDYFGKQARAGKCPPGLAKKNNGCNPPGQVKQWEIGRPLPADIRWYELEPDLLSQLGQAPTGYRYAALDNDILLLELGTQVVVDVIQALSE